MNVILGGKNIPTYTRCRKMLEYWCSNGQDGNWKDVIHTSFDKFQRKVLKIALLCCGPEIYISMLDNDSQGHKLEMIVMWSIKFWPEPWLMIASTSKLILGEICISNIRCWIAEIQKINPSPWGRSSLASPFLGSGSLLGSWRALIAPPSTEKMR